MFRKKDLNFEWITPTVGWIKLDRSSHPNLQSIREEDIARDGIFRDHKGYPLYSFYNTIPRKSSKYPEASALCRGLQLAILKKWSNIWAEGDCRNLIDSVNEKSSPRWAHTDVYPIIDDIRQHMSFLDNCIVTFIYREGYSVVDLFCQKVKRKVGNFVWHGT